MKTIIIPDIPPSLNRYIGRNAQWQYRAAKKAWDELVYAYARPHAPKKPPDKAMVHIHFVFPDRRRHDAGNCEKFITDGLTMAGVIKDDNIHCITLTLDGEYRKGVKQTEITITET